MMRFGKVTVKSRADFNGSKHLKWSNVSFGTNNLGNPFATLHLPLAKTAEAGEIQKVHISEHKDICPLEALLNLAKVVPAGLNDPLFSWHDKKGDLRPIVCKAALKRINSITTAWGWGTSFGHSFHIGGTSHYMSLGKDPEIIHIAGCWKSLAYQTYLRAFELVVMRHMNTNPANCPPRPLGWA
ncbi:reverse transcriptase ribonuclease h [Moniliophthora roreri MCA 2997]|uniref:Reverse transcriptase ribonuclease h n=2 Tax=Moniliophthora roreri TaxID=221103 RepID=V2XPB4_MONRO|nr:reverse transcriptase ribonuclease h [Moniliophthora roreri MCA 2997]